MATVAKEKDSWISILWEFQAKATIISSEKMLHPIPLILVTRALDPSNGFVQQESWSKFYDTLMYRFLW